MLNKAIYALSGDPITYGHINIVDRALKVFDHLTVAIGINSDKKYTFSLKAREQMAKEVLSTYCNQGRVTVCSFEGLLVDFAYSQGIKTIIRGVRGSGDVDYEKILYDINRSQISGIDTFVLFSDPHLSHISSSAVKELQKNHARNILQYVPLIVKRELEKVISGQYLIGITGEIGAGKSYVASKLAKIPGPYKEGLIIDFDILGHKIIESATDHPVFQDIRLELIEKFGNNILKTDHSNNCFIDRKKLGSCLWGNEKNIEMFNSIMQDGLDYLYRQELLNFKGGLVIVDGALLAEAGLTRLVNNNIIVVKASKEVRKERLKKRGYSDSEIDKRMNSQLDADKKIDLINKKIEENKCGKVVVFDNDKENDASIQHLFDEIIKVVG